MLFRKKQNNGLFSQVDDSRQVVYDFRCRTDILFENYRTVSYKKPPSYDFETMKKEALEVLEKLITANAVDAGNEDCLIDKILGPVKNGICYLEDQFIEHMDFYTRQGSRAVADSSDISELLAFWENKEAAMIREHELTQRLWDNYCGDSTKEV